MCAQPKAVEMGDVVALRPGDRNSCSFRFAWHPGDAWIDGPVATRYVAVSIEAARKMNQDLRWLAAMRKRAADVASLSTILSRIYGAEHTTHERAARAVHAYLTVGCAHR
jgi:hypothetical protein